MSELECVFMRNGNTAFFKNGQQVPELQKAWIILYFEFLEKHKINPLEVKFQFPDGSRAKAFKTSTNGYNWNLLMPL